MIKNENNEKNKIEPIEPSEPKLDLSFSSFFSTKKSMLQSYAKKYKLKI